MPREAGISSSRPATAGLAVAGIQRNLLGAVAVGETDQQSDTTLICAPDPG